jgi:hypothetical protein
MRVHGNHGSPQREAQHNRRALGSNPRQAQQKLAGVGGGQVAQPVEAVVAVRLMNRAQYGLDARRFLVRQPA